MRHHRRHFGPRTRWQTQPGDWRVRARIERFVEPAILLILSERPRHGYELIELLPELTGEDRIDVGNLYRLLRGLEEDGLLDSEWRGDLPGPAKRTYTLTSTGRKLLDRWAEALGAAHGEIEIFLERYDEGR
jgi:PadR family transcriptional regulator PadR